MTELGRNIKIFFLATLAQLGSQSLLASPLLNQVYAAHDEWTA